MSRARAAVCKAALAATKARACRIDNVRAAFAYWDEVYAGRFSAY